MVRSVQDLAVRVLGDLGVRQKGEKDADQCVHAGYRRSLWTKILSPKETRFSLPKGDYFSVGSPNTTHQKVSFPSGVQATPMPISS